jgi:hypothetical protein
MGRWFLLLLSGCSLTLSGPDPNRPRNNRPACDTSKALVVLDGALAAATGVVALGLASDGDGGAAVAPALVGSLFLLSAVHGNNTVNACNREMDSYASSLVPLPEPQVAQQPPVQPAAMPVMPPPPPVAPPPVPPVQPPPPAPATNDSWSAFWREVP